MSGIWFVVFLPSGFHVAQTHETQAAWQKLPLVQTPVLADLSWGPTPGEGTGSLLTIAHTNHGPKKHIGLSDVPFVSIHTLSVCVCVGGHIYIYIVVYYIYIYIGVGVSWLVALSVTICEGRIHLKGNPGDRLLRDIPTRVKRHVCQAVVSHRFLRRNPMDQFGLGVCFFLPRGGREPNYGSETSLEILGLMTIALPFATVFGRWGRGSPNKP